MSASVSVVRLARSALPPLRDEQMEWVWATYSTEMSIVFLLGQVARGRGQGSVFSVPLCLCGENFCVFVVKGLSYPLAAAFRRRKISELISPPSNRKKLERYNQSIRRIRLARLP